jgi:heme exporter protein A
MNLNVMNTLEQQHAEEILYPDFEIKNLECTRQDIILFQDINFRLNAGDILQIDGVNGSGKTSMIRIMAGLIKPTAGEVYWRGTAISDCRYEYQREISYIGHLNGIKEGLTSLENMRVARDLASNNDAIHFSNLLERMGLAGMDEVYVNAMSAGQRRRLALTRLLIDRKKLWLLDEPFTSLDAEGKATIEQMIIEHSNAGGIIIFATHQPLEIKNCTLLRIHLR